MAKLEYLIIHCTATPEGMNISREWIEQVHLVKNGWSQVGYSELIHLDGTIETLVEYNDDDFVDRCVVRRAFNALINIAVLVGPLVHAITRPRRTQHKHATCQP